VIGEVLRGGKVTILAGRYSKVFTALFARVTELDPEPV
jgi:hypothetical protein